MSAAPDDDDDDDATDQNVESDELLNSVPDIVEDCFGCYLLYCENRKYLGRSYIGFTVDPNRRLKQHNGGSQFGGARRTSNRGPWAMILFIHGFPNQISALRFEWAWQHPGRSRRLNHLPPKKSKEKSFHYNLRLVSEMLKTGPWNRLPLTVRWLRPDLIPSLKAELTSEPPLHMPIVYGSIKSKKIAGGGCAKRKKNPNQIDPTIEHNREENLICSICFAEVRKNDSVQCLEPKCSTISHLSCLANHFLATSGDAEKDLLLPIHGKCPVCDLDSLWGDIIRKMKGCYNSTAR